MTPLPVSGSSSPSQAVARAPIGAPVRRLFHNMHSSSFHGLTSWGPREVSIFPLLFRSTQSTESAANFVTDDGPLGSRLVTTISPCILTDVRDGSPSVPKGLVRYRATSSPVIVHTLDRVPSPVLAIQMNDCTWPGHSLDPAGRGAASSKRDVSPSEFSRRDVSPSEFVSRPVSSRSRRLVAWH